MASNEIENTETWNLLKKDNYLAQFLIYATNKNNDENLSILTQSLTASEQLARLTKGINLLQKELQTLVHHNHSNLISQGTWVEKLESTLLIMREHIQSLQKSVCDIRNKIVEPFNEVEKHSQILTRLHETSNILRCIVQIRQLSKNLPKHDIVKASSLIKEVDDFCKDVNLSDIDILEEDKKIIENERQQIYLTGKKNLIEALNNENETEAVPSIQIFINLNVLEEVIQNFKISALTEIEKSTKLTLDIQSLTNQSTEQDKTPKLKGSGPGRITGNTFPGVNVAAFRSKLWSNWSNLLETTVYPKCAQIYILLSTISKQNQSTLNSENRCFENINEVNIINELWNQITKILSTHLISAAEESSFIKQALEGEYPKLLRLHADLNKKLKILIKKHTISSSKNLQELFNNNSQFASQFENAYLSRSISRLLDAVHGMFSGEEPPTVEEIDTFSQQLSNELGVSLVDENLCKTVARNIGKAIHLFCLKSEQILVFDGNSSQVIGVVNSAQQLNISIANNAFYLKQQCQNILLKMSSKLPEYCKNEIITSLANIDVIQKNIIEPITNSISEAIDSIILTMHKENFHIEKCEEPVSCSLYLKELQQFISRSYTNYLQPFRNQEMLEKYRIYLADRCVELFLRHVCLVRPVEQGGRQKLQEDFKKIEIAVTPLCSEISNIGDNFKTLRAFRSLVSCTNPEQIVSNELLGKILPYSLTLMLLFSHAPPEIPSPHESCNWSVARLSQWLDNHPSERERLELISGALLRYQQNIRQQNKTTFHAIYPIMMNLLDRGFQFLKLQEN